jgi:hypothetical protein
MFLCVLLFGFLKNWIPTYNEFTDFTTQSQSSEDNRHLVLYNFPLRLWNLKNHYRIHYSTPYIPIVSHIDLAHSLLYYFFHIHFNIILS